MMRRLLSALALCLLPGLAVAQFAIIEGGTPIVGPGTTGQCVTKSAAGLAVLAACSPSTAPDITVNTTTVTGGTNGNVLTIGSGKVQSGATTGSGNVVLGTSPSITTPSLDQPTISTVAFASLPAPGTAGRLIRVSNVGGAGSLFMDNGTRWRPVNGCVHLATLNTAVTGISTTPGAVAFQYQMPAAMLAVGDRLRFRGTMTKSGSTGTGTMRALVGVLGTTSDPIVMNNGPFLSAAQLSGGLAVDFRVDSATTMKKVPNAGTSGNTSGYTSVTNNADGAAATIDNISGSLFFSIQLFVSATDTVGLSDAQLDYCASPT